MKKSVPYAFLGAIFGLLSSGAAVAGDDCVKLSASVKDSVTAKPGDLLQIVEKTVTANPGCACEVVKAAIEGSHATPETVASIVRTASTAAPDQMRLIAQCSLAAAPDAMTNVQSVLAQFDPGTGGGSYSAKEAGGYLYARNIRLGKAVPTKSADHYRVVDVHGVFLGDLKNTGAVADARVRATSNVSGSGWVYFAHVPVPGEGWKHGGGGILVVHTAEDGNFHLLFDDDLFNPLNLAGSDPTAIVPPLTTGGGSGGLPPGPGTNTPPVISPPIVVTPTSLPPVP